MMKTGGKKLAGFLVVAVLTIFFAGLYYYIVSGLRRHAVTSVEVLSHYSSRLIADRLQRHMEAVELLTGLSASFLEADGGLPAISGINNGSFHVHVALLDDRLGLLYFDEHTGQAMEVEDDLTRLWAHILSRATERISIAGPLPSLSRDGGHEILVTRAYRTVHGGGSFGLALRMDVFEQELRNLGWLSRDGRSFFLVDSDKRLVASSEEIPPHSEIADAPLLASLPEAKRGSGVWTHRHGDMEYFVGVSRLPEIGWTLYAFSPRLLEMQAQPLVAWTLGVGWVLLCVCILLLQHFLRQQDKYKVLSELDHLTGAHNRLAFEQSLGRCNQPGYYPVSLFVMDVDGLKVINDALGHEAGDALLRRVMLLLQRSLRDLDVIYRIGGDEFAVILPQVSYATAQNLAERVTVQAALMREKTGLPPVFLSLGFAEAVDAETYATLFARADEAMYTNKKIRKEAARRAILRWIKDHPGQEDRRKHQQGK